ncbi:hydroxyacylglutathione hydrolase [Marilutibacter alkalisoli]|uniref:Hydroxyacylglutathione hydrolase n=1 Tax=Marilutibacter alkalisoli TaxID=2591633 RepID=A0A514BT68_9GAMM|nr:hydroxyacylglutathione hydrolase [Lysobacter alkalisoli]QDH70547.1 hydroxyacylglutathione hydrolase [Lysobacter alkalisoli]
MRLRALPSRQDNYIWTLSDADGNAIVVDPGESAPVFAAAAEGLKPAAILLTHHHYDHIDGTAELLERWPKLPVHAPDDTRIPFPTRTVGEGDRLEPLGIPTSVMEVPGHTLSHIAFHLTLDGDQWLFCGDTLFSLGCGRLFEGTPDQMHRSLQRLAALPGATRVCCGHEYTLSNAAFARAVEPDNPALLRRIEEATTMRQSGHPSLPSTLDSERACNPFLRCDQPGVIDAVADRLGRPLRDAVETFAELRRWKDGFAA